MVRNAVHVDASQEETFDVLLDPLAYPRWVVGARGVRAVDPEWPAVGSAFHHESGVAGEVEDRTEVLELDRPRRIALRAFFRPFGVARVVMTVEAEGDGSRVTMEENPELGTRGRLLAPITSPMLRVRNTRSLRLFRDLVEARATSPTGEAPPARRRGRGTAAR